MRKVMATVFMVFLVVGLIGCAQLTSIKDGFLGTPMDTATNGGDIPAWYHVGQALNPFIHALIAIVRTVIGV